MKERRGGRGGGGGGIDAGIPDELFDELKKKLPRPHPKVPTVLTCEAQGETGKSRSELHRLDLRSQLALMLSGPASLFCSAAHSADEA